MHCQNEKDMKELVELQLYPELREWIEEISYFFGNEVEESNADYYNYEYLDDCLLLMEEWYNCKHVHNYIIEALQEACERELFNRGIYGQIKLNGNIITFKIK